MTPGTAAPQPAENLPSPDPAMSGDPAAAGYNAPSPYPSTDATNGYFASDPGRNLGAGSYQDCGVDGYMEDCDDGSQWFGGVYGLYMTRSQPGYRRYTVGVDPPTNPYFPAASDTENESDCNFLIPDWREGIEVRLGCTFGIGDSCDYGDCDSGCGGCGEACGCEPSCNPVLPANVRLGSRLLGNRSRSAGTVRRRPRGGHLPLLRHDQLCRPGIR